MNEPTLEEVADCIDAAHDVLLVDGWARGQMRTPDGRHCTVGAVMATERPARFAAVHRVAQQLGFDVANVYDACPTVVRWNDHPQRTIDDVLDLFRFTAKELREQVQQ